MMHTYEAWRDPDGSSSFSTAENIKRLMESRAVSPDASLLHRFSANTAEEATAIHHLRMGWEPYVPLGEAQTCPNDCGAFYYPEGSGECPNCGLVRKAFKVKDIPGVEDF